MLRVLLMDDEPHICQLLQRIINWEEKGFQIVGEAHDGVEGLKKVFELSPDVVVMDIRMPGMDGLSLIQKVKKDKPDLAFVIVSGYSDFSYAQTALQQGVQGYLLKPVDRRELENVLQAIQARIHQKRQEQHEKTLLRTRLSDSMQQLSTHFFNSLLAEKAEDVIDEEQVNERYGCMLRKGFFRVIQYKVDTAQRGSDISEEKPNSVIRAAIAKQLPPTAFTSILLEEKPCLLQILNYAPGTHTVKRLEELFAALQNACRYTGYRVTLGVGREVNDIGQISLSNEDASRCVHSRIRLGTGKIIDAAACRLNGSPANELMTMEERKQLETLIEISDGEGAKECFSQMLRRAAENADDDALYQIGKEAFALLPFDSEQVAQTLEQQYEDCSSMEQLVAFFSGALLAARNSISKDKRIHIIERAKAYVSGHYMEELQIRDVADTVNLTPKYFSELFKRETGERFTDYICRFRMDIAMDKLKNTCERVNEIAAAIGYQDPKHFSKQFHKTVGVSPAQFRKIAAR